MVIEVVYRSEDHVRKMNFVLAEKEQELLRSKF